MDELRHDSTLIVVDQLEPEGLVSDNASYFITVQHKAKKGLTSVMLVMGKGYREPIRNATEQGHFDG